MPGEGAYGEGMQTVDLSAAQELPVWRRPIALLVLMSFAIGFFRVPTEANVFYSCRGLWAILLVAFLGRRMGLREGNVSRSTQIRRAIGAGLLVLGIYLAPMG